jgi:hypothetical protein
MCYHASESSNFEPYDASLHVGSIQQAMDIIKNMKTKKHYEFKKFYVYELEVSLGSISDVLFDEDPHIEDSTNLRHNSYAYTNRIEHSHGFRQGSNISVVITNPTEQVISKKLVKVI